MGKRLGGFLPPPRLIPEIDGNCSSGREKRQGCVKELRNRIKPQFSGEGTYRKFGEFPSQASSSFPHSKLLIMQGFKGNGNSRLLGAINLRRQRILKVNPLETARNQTGS